MSAKEIEAALRRIERRLDKLDRRLERMRLISLTLVSEQPKATPEPRPKSKRRRAGRR